MQNLFDIGTVGIAAEDGQLLWFFKIEGRLIPTPICQNNTVLVPRNDSQFVLLKLSATGNATTWAVACTNRAAWAEYQTPVLLDGHLYGDHRWRLGCSDFASGKLLWTADYSSGINSGSIAAADGHLYYRGEQGDMYLVEANPKAFVQFGAFKQPERSGKPTYAPPVIANRRLYLRDQDLLLCFDIAAKERRPLKLLTCVPPSRNVGAKLVVGACDGTPLTFEEMGKVDILATSNLQLNLTNWTVLNTTPQLTNGQININDSTARGVNRRFYMIREW